MKDRMRNIIVFGAASTIAHKTILEFCKTDENHFILIGRNEERLNSIKSEVETRNSTATVLHCDATNIDEVILTANVCLNLVAKIDILYIAHGSLADNDAVYKNNSKLISEMNTNFLSVITFITELLPRFEEQKDGVIAVISSVAGDRGRQSNFIYGTAKAAISTYLSGLRNKLFPFGVHVLTIKPGFVDTQMTKDVPKNPLFAKPEFVAKKIVEAIKNETDILYVPGFWKYIMMIIKSIPEGMFKKLKL